MQSETTTHRETMTRRETVTRRETMTHRETTLHGLGRDPRALLDALTNAYAVGDMPRGEHLLAKALDDDLPWDEVCAAAARGVTRRYHGAPRA